MGSAAGVGADQGPASTPVLFGSWTSTRWAGSMWSAAVLLPALPGRSMPATGLPSALAAVVDEREQRVVAERLLPGRGGLLLLRMGQDQHLVNVHHRLAAGIGGRLPGQPPDPLARARRIAVSARGPGPSEGVDEVRDSRIGGHRTNTAGSARSKDTSARQSSSRATATATSSRILPGSCTACCWRRGSKAVDIASPSPARRAVSIRSNSPACESTAGPPPAQRTHGYD